VDVLSTIDLGRMVKDHSENQALATLAVQTSRTSRYLLFVIGDSFAAAIRERWEPELARLLSSFRRWLFRAFT